MDLNRTDMSLLVALDALLQEGGVTAAAKRLGISQPAMSAQLAKLRHRLGDQVLVGDAHGMVPTDRAAALQGPIRAHLSALQELISAAGGFDPAVSARTFTIAGTDYTHQVVMPPLLERLRSTAPAIRIATKSQIASDVKTELERGTIDLLLTSERLLPSGVSVRKVFTDHFVLVGRKGHPEAGHWNELDVFCDLDHLLVSPTGGSFEGAVDTALAKIRRTRRVNASLTDFLLVVSVLLSSDHVAVLPGRVVAPFADRLAVTSPPIPLPQIEIYMGWHPRAAQDAGHQWLRGALADGVSSETRKSRWSEDQRLFRVRESGASDGT